MAGPISAGKDHSASQQVPQLKTVTRTDIPVEDKSLLDTASRIYQGADPVSDTNPLPVFISNAPPASPDVVLNRFNESFGVVPGVLTDVLTYIVPLLNTLYLSRIEASGNNSQSTYEIWIDGTKIAKDRTYFGGPIGVDFQFESPSGQGYKVNAGSQITVKVLHNRPFNGDYEARISAILRG